MTLDKGQNLLDPCSPGTMVLMPVLLKHASPLEVRTLALIEEVGSDPCVHS